MFAHPPESGAQEPVPRDDGFVQVDLPVHQPPGNDIIFDGVDALGLDDDTGIRTALLRMHPHGFDDAIYAHISLYDTRIKRIAPQEVQAVHIQLAGNELVKKRTFVRTVEYLQRQVQGALEAFIERNHELPAHVFMTITVNKGMFQYMGERTVSDVVQHRSRLCGNGFFGRYGRSLVGKIRKGVLHQSHGAERMTEARMFGAGEHEMPYTQLADASQALHFRRSDQVHENVFRNGDEPVHRIAEYFESTYHELRDMMRFDKNARTICLLQTSGQVTTLLHCHSCEQT